MNIPRNVKEIVNSIGSASARSLSEYSRNQSRLLLCTLGRGSKGFPGSDGDHSIGEAKMDVGC